MPYYNLKTMKDAITEYQQWKQQGKDLRSKAKQAIETRFKELLTEAMHLAEEYRSDFGGTLTPPAVITAFRYKAGAKKATPKPKPTAAAPVIELPKAKPDPKLVRMRKTLEAAQNKLEDAKAKGSPTKNLEDRIYEIEDTIRLATQKS